MVSGWNTLVIIVNIQILLSQVHSESIHTPSLFPHFVTLQPYSKMDEIKTIPHQYTHTIPHNDKAKTGF